jgi:DNA polymerase-3 subunit alpha
MNIAHALSARSDFSIGESTLQIDRLVKRAKELNYQSVAVVDIMNISGMVTLSDKCRDAGIKPIVGCTVRVYDDPTYRKPKKGEGAEVANPFYWLKVYPKTEAGMHSLLKLLSKGFSKEHFYYHARVGLQDVLDLDDVVVTTGDMFNLFHHNDHKVILQALKSRHSTYVEIVSINTPLFDTLNTRALAAAEEFGVPLIGTRPVHYGDPSEADSADVLRAICVNGKVNSPWSLKPYVRDLALESPVELAKRLKEIKLPAFGIDQLRAALAGIESLAAECQYEFKKLAPTLPKMAENEFAALLAECKAGWDTRFSGPVLGHQPTDLTPYKERLAYELGVLKSMGFAGYFLLVQDIVRWSKQNEIMVGPGRGSVGGSLVAYLLEITDVDPIRFDLLFERFINPDRLDLPDADLDFMSKRRHEVVAYITEKYGQDRVAGISNYNALGAASSIRDVSRVHELDRFSYDCSKQVEKVHGVTVGLEESAELVPDIDKFRLKYPDIWKHAVNLEGAMRSMGKHAAGVVVSGEPLINRAVVETREGNPVVNWDKRFVEDWGLIKMDILGLSTLDMLGLGRTYVKDMHGVDVRFLTLPLDDAKVLQAFGEGKTAGVFQFESPGMRRLLKDMASGATLTFDDLVAVVALYRPGPLDAGLCDEYVAIKKGEKSVHFEHPNMEPALAPTYGVIVYQEQVMRIARDLAGFTFAEADHLRKAMGKKDREMMAKQRDKWVAGCGTTSSMGEAQANALFDKIEVFAGYAFNKSHSVEYSVISYWSMWLKVNYPSAFYAASMTIVDDNEKLIGLVNDARENKVKVLPPDINFSSDKIEIAGHDKLYCPFQAVKGVSEKVAAHILRARKCWGKPFTSRTDFAAALAAEGISGKVNVMHRERLERVGAFAECEADKIGATHPDRLKDQLEFLPGFTTGMVKVDREIPADFLSKIKLERAFTGYQSCTACPLSGNAHPLPRMGTQPKFMMVFDAPNWQEEGAGMLIAGDTGKLVLTALRDAGLDAKYGYFTTLVKSGKPKGQKTLTNEQINACTPHLLQEIEILKPPVIVTMGAASTRFFVPGAKGGTAELSGKVIFDAKYDASIIMGLNPAQILFDPSKVEILHTVCRRIGELIT